MKYFIALFFIAMTLSAQDLPVNAAESAMERYIEQSEESDDLQYRAEELEYLRQHPVNVTRPSYGDLLRIPFISPLLAESIIRFTDTVTVTGVEQLRNADLMTPKLFTLIEPFIAVSDPASEKFWSWLAPEKAEFRSRWERKIQLTKGFSDHKYLGDPFVSYQRFRIENSTIEVAAMTEKDAGELSRERFIARYGEVKNIGIIRNIIIGNFNTSAGQGLVFARNISAGKGSDAVGQIMKRGSVITPSLSTDEFRYFDGVAMQVGSDVLSVTGLYSSRSLPASIDTLGKVTGVYTSGLYRNQHEIVRRNSLKEKMLGGVVQFPIHRGAALTFSAVQISYGREMDPSLFHLDGERNLSAGSMSWDLSLLGIKTFGEIASKSSKTYSKIGGIILPVGRSLSFSYLRRSYAPGYSTPFARPFAERTDIGKGESGNYLGMELNIERTSVSAYFDQYEFPPENGEFSVHGKESFVHVVQDVSRKSEVTAQIRKSYRQQESEYEKTSYRVSHRLRLSKSFSVSQRIDVVQYYTIANSNTEKGLLASIDCQYNDRTAAFSFRSRMTWFQSQSYNSRLYQYEPDVPGNYSNPPMYGSGLRWFFLTQYKIGEFGVIGLKYTETKKLDEIVIGSGDEQIQGNLESRIAAQIDFRF